jgi:hypothetical protein
MTHNRSCIRGEARKRERMRCTVMAIGFLVILLFVPACGSTGTTPDPSAEQTNAALAEQLTSLANQSQQLTEQAAQQPEPTAEATPLPTQNPTPTSTQSPAPTATPTESPYIEGSMVRAEYDPAAGWGPPDVYEDFEGASGLFFVRSGDNYAGWYGNGRYNISFESRGWWTWFWSETHFTDFYMEVLVFNGDQCVDRDTAGLLFLGQPSVDEGYLFGVTCGGEYFIGGTGSAGPGGPVCIPDWSEPFFWNCESAEVALASKESEYIDPGPGAVNRLGVMYKSPEISFYINGHRVDGFQNIMLGHPWANWPDGCPALYLHPGQRDISRVSFDEFSAWHNP